MAEPTLQQALNFTDEDLVANRAGRLGPTQQGRMTKTKGRSQVTNLIFGAVFLVIIVVIAAYVLPQYLNASGDTQSYAPVIVVVLIVVVAIIGLSIWRSRRKLTRLDGAVLMTEGAASARQGLAPVSGGAVLPMYRLSIGKVDFALATPEPMRAFVNGKQYRGYYVQGTLPILVSAEEVE